MTTSRSPEYAPLRDDAERPKRVVDHRDAWERLTPLLRVNGTARERIEAFAAAKRVSLDALVALGTRVRVDKNGGVELAWGYPLGEAVTAIKFRPLGDKPRYALTPSVFVEPLVIGRTRSLDWFVAEGETDTARLYDLVGGAAAILVLPAGALTFRREWAAVIPRGATVYLCHDADEAGDKGAEKAAEIIGGRTVRLRPPESDWCDWTGTREQFVEFVKAAKLGEREVEPLDLTTLLAGPVPQIAWLWSKWIAEGELALFVATARTGKSITALLLACATRVGKPLLGADCKRGNAGYIDLENPLPTVHLRLRQAGLAADEHDGFTYWHFPAIDLTSDEGERWLLEMIERHELILLVLDSFRRIAPGVDENDSAAVSAFFAPLRRVAVATGCTILLLHHPKKRQGDTPDDTTELVRGSGDFTAAVDTLLFARPKPPDAFTLEGFGKRTGYRHEPILVRLSAPESETLELTNEGGVAYAEDKVEALLERVLKELRSDGGTLTRPELALRLGVDSRNSTFTRALKLGWQREQLAKSERKPGQPTVYSLRPELAE
jgi:AAA domain